MQTDNQHVETMILAGGFGTRLHTVIQDLPKPMAPVAGRPFLEWLILSLSQQGIRKITICTGYLGHMIESHFHDGQEWGVEITYSSEKTALGTGGAVLNALDHMKGDTFLIMNGDSFCNYNIQQMIEKHSYYNASVTFWLEPMNDCSRYGSVIIDETGLVIDFKEKQRVQHSGLINAGVYIMDRKLISKFPQGKQISLESEVFPTLLKQNMYAVIGKGVFIDIGTPESYSVANKYFPVKILTIS